MIDRPGTGTAGVLLALPLAAILAAPLAPEAKCGVLVQAFYKLPGDEGVPTPSGGAAVDFWWDRLAKQAKPLAEAGVTAVWLPPASKGGNGTNTVGYDPFDDYDLGSKDQKGAQPTRYGTREQLARCVAILRANGIDVYLDIVNNQRSGGEGPGGFKFRYVDAFGHPGGGRFPKDPENFHFSPAGIPQDPNVPGPDISFGSDLAPIYGKPPGYVSSGLKAAGDWMTRALDIQGYRIDDPKGISNDFTRDYFNSGAMRGKFVVGEFYDGDVGKVEDWIQRGTGGRCASFDFPLRFNFLTDMCNRAGFFNMASLDHAGLAGIDPARAVTFVENHDLDLSDPIVRNKPQGYAYILTSEGYPCVFYKDYSTDPGCYGMKAIIDNLIFIHEKIANGPTQQRFKNFDVFAYERTGGAHLLVGLNNNGAADKTITVATGFGANVSLHDYTGHAGDVSTDGGGQVTITIPRNTGGLGYVCYSRPGIGGAFPVAGRDVTQDYEGAQDLDIKPADAAAPVQVCRVFVEGGRPIRGALRFDTSHWTGATSIKLELSDPSGVAIATRDYTGATPQGDAMTAAARPGAAGFYTFKIRSTNAPAANPRPSYKLSVTYRAPRELK